MKIYCNLFMENGNRTLSFQVKIARKNFDKFFFSPDMKQFENGNMFEGMPYNSFIDLTNVAKKVVLLPVIVDASYTFIDGQAFSYEVPEIVAITTICFNVITGNIPELESKADWHAMYETVYEFVENLVETVRDASGAEYNEVPEIRKGVISEFYTGSDYLNRAISYCRK